jgi:hypothetical protein
MGVAGRRQGSQQPLFVPNTSVLGGGGGGARGQQYRGKARRVLSTGPPLVNRGLRVRISPSPPHLLGVYIIERYYSNEAFFVPVSRFRWLYSFKLKLWTIFPFHTRFSRSTSTFPLDCRIMRHQWFRTIIPVSFQPENLIQWERFRGSLSHLRVSWYGPNIKMVSPFQLSCRTIQRRSNQRWKSVTFFWRLENDYKTCGWL